MGRWGGERYNEIRGARIIRVQRAWYDKVG